MANHAGKHQQLKPHQWQKGQSGNPNGKATGTRDKLGNAFLEKMLADFEKHGEKAIADAREDSPLGYLNALVRIMPQEVNVNQKNDILERLIDLDENELASLQQGFDMLGNVLADSEGKGNKGGSEKLSQVH